MWDDKETNQPPRPIRTIVNLRPDAGELQDIWDRYDRDKAQQQREGFRLSLGGQVTALDPDEYVIDDALPLDALGFFFGLDQTFKSFVLIDSLLSIAMGMNWAGRATRQGPTVLIAAEGQKSIAKRVMGWCLKRLGQLTLPKGTPFYISDGAAAFCAGGNTDAVRTSLAQVAEAHGGLMAVGVDTLRKNMGTGKEAGPDDMAISMNEMWRAIVQFASTRSHRHCISILNR